jgi:hypothetical protein
MKEEKVIILSYHEMATTLYAHFVNAGIVTNNQFDRMTIQMIIDPVDKNKVTFKCVMFNEGKEIFANKEVKKKEDEGRHIIVGD